METLKYVLLASCKVMLNSSSPFGSKVKMGGRMQSYLTTYKCVVIDCFFLRISRLLIIIRFCLVVKEQLHEMEQKMHELEMKMEEKDRELHAIKLDTEAVC